MTELLWEIGCEELPATFVAPTLAQIEQLFRDKFTAARLWSGDADIDNTLRVIGTPRRLVLHVNGLADRQPDETLVVKGPAEHIAFNAEGEPSKAAIGFANKNGVQVGELTVVDGYVQATVKRVGQSASEIAAELLPKIARELTFPKAMRWGSGKLRFARPIRWILALLDNEVVPFSIEHVATGRKTRGHRFLSPDEVEVPTIDAYFHLMREKFVLLDPDERRGMIVDQATSLAKHEAEGVVQINPALLDENVFLTEYPTAVLGSFSPEFLELPTPVLITAMRKHQRYFPVFAQDGSLLPRFVAVRNGGGDYLDTVRAGYEQVLVARFNDAKFFFDLDTTTPLSAKIDGTKNIVFQEKLGTVYEKSLRFGPILRDSGLLSELGAAESQNVLRAAELAKADLASEMVKELPALQGIVGQNYAERDGEPEAVAVAIAEHYMPKGAGEALPGSLAGRLLAIADRVDTLTGYSGIGIFPTGTSDPFALRRAGSGLVALLGTERSLPALASLFGAAWNAYHTQGIALTETREQAYTYFLTLIGQRLNASLEDKGVRYDVRDAVLAAPITHVFDTQARAVTLGAQADSAGVRQAAAALLRIGNILRFAVKEGVEIPTTDADPALFEQDVEGQLWSAYLETRSQYATAADAGDWDKALELLGALRPAVDAFFESVMVMGDDVARRANRLALLSRVHETYNEYAEFDKLVG
jgi:glycyl-tRNA synthetase beta chain